MAMRYCKYCLQPQAVSLSADLPTCANCGRTSPRWTWKLINPTDEPTPARTPQLSPDDVCRDCGKPGTYLSHSTPDKNGICYECERRRVAEAEKIPVA